MELMSKEMFPISFLAIKLQYFTYLICTFFVRSCHTTCISISMAIFKKFPPFGFIKIDQVLSTLRLPTF